MVRVKCIKCGLEGSLTMKQTTSKGIMYEYWYIEHHLGNKIKWCYLGKFDKLPEDYKKSIHGDTQKDTQNVIGTNNLKLSHNSQNNPEKSGRGSLAWFGRQTHNLENKQGQTPNVQRSRVRIPPPAFLDTPPVFRPV